jgi:hypothetical protein
VDKARLEAHGFSWALALCAAHPARETNLSAFSYDFNEKDFCAGKDWIL